MMKIKRIIPFILLSFLTTACNFLPSEEKQEESFNNHQTPEEETNETPVDNVPQENNHNEEDVPSEESPTDEVVHPESGCSETMPTVINVTSLILDHTSVSLHVDEEVQLRVSYTPVDATEVNFTWVSSNEDVVIVSSDGLVHAYGIGDTTVSVIAPNGIKSFCPVSVIEEPAPISQNDLILIKDTLDFDFVGQESPAETAQYYSYWNWSEKVGASGAIYAGNTASGNKTTDPSTFGEVIQIRSNKAGIIVTNSGGYVHSVTLNFHEATYDNRYVDIYGLNEPYTAVDNLYSAEERGTLVGSVYKADGLTGTVTFTDAYQYIGIRSRSSALYLRSIVIVWGNQPPVGE